MAGLGEFFLKGVCLLFRGLAPVGCYAVFPALPFEPGKGAFTQQCLDLFLHVFIRKIGHFGITLEKRFYYK